MLTTLGWLYGKIANLRNALYDKGLLASHSLGARTISIGNITVGGTGKTPLVAHVAEVLAERGEKVAILSRGYGRENARQRVLVSDGETVLVDAKTGGDEPVELAMKLLGKAIVIADADRVSAAKWAKENYGITAFVLDDGFQHRKAKRDLDIVCIDATNPFGNGKVLPAGILRESLQNLGRANAVILTRANLAGTVEETALEIRKYTESPIFLAESNISGVTELEKFHAETQRPQRRSHESEAAVKWESVRAVGNPDNPDNEVRLLAFCALGNPNGFFNQLSEKFDEDSMDEFDLGAIKKFPDHRRYSEEDIFALEKQAKKCNIDALLTTAKDAVKLKGLTFTLPCFVVEIETRIKDESVFIDLVTASSSQAVPSYRPSKTL